MVSGDFETGGRPLVMTDGFALLLFVEQLGRWKVLCKSEDGDKLRHLAGALELCGVPRSVVLACRIAVEEDWVFLSEELPASPAVRNVYPDVDKLV